LVTGISALLHDSAKRFPRQPALTAGEQDLSYCELVMSVEQLAERLARDVAVGQRVAIVAPNVPALVVALFAVWHVGGVAVPINARNREYELRRVLRDADAVAVVSVASFQGFSFAELLPRLLPDLPLLRRWYVVDASGTLQPVLDGAGGVNALGECEPLDPDIGLILYTSGTTGLPRGALITHQSEVAGAFGLDDVLASGPRDVCVFAVPISHAFGMTCLLGCIASGGRAVLINSTFSLDPLLRAVQEHDATVLHGSPALWTLLLKSSSRPLASLRTGFVAGGACPPVVLEELDEAGLRVLNLYGMTELGAVAACRAEDAAHVRHTTVGRALPDYQVRVVGGEVRVAGPYVTPGYYRQPDQTAAAFDDGWFRTGDLGWLDEDANLTITGRAKDVVHVGGLSVFPAEVEGFLLTHADVERAAVLGVPHPTMGETLVAFVVPRRGANLTPAALIQFARPRIAGYKLPYSIHLVTEIPTLPTGKADRSALLDLLQQGER
jgi:acyl-CoA synthetase (AMP-forming)/AMP-acid ligase II